MFEFFFLFLLLWVIPMMVLSVDVNDAVCREIQTIFVFCKNHNLGNMFSLVISIVKLSNVSNSSFEKMLI